MKNRVTLLINWYNDKNQQRQNELNSCLTRNINNKFIDTIVLIHEKDVNIPFDRKIIGVTVESRPDFNKMFEIGNLFDGIKIISNTDIYFNDTIHLAHRIMDNQVFALCRWDVMGNGELKFFNKNDSQDVWIYKGVVKNLKADFNMGVLGCDNCIAYELEEVGFNVLSPSEDIQAVHLHTSNVRNYDSFRLNIERPFKILKLINFANPKDYTILFKYPIRGRKDKFFSTLDKYYSMKSDNPNFKFIISMDIDDLDLNTKQVRKKLDKYKNLEYYYDNNKSKIEAINNDIPTDGYDIIVLVSDDMIPIISNFDEIIREEMSNYFPDTDGVLWFSDGSKNAQLLNTLCILGIKWYKRFNYIYNDEYKSLYCDKEFMEIANKEKRQIYFDNCIIRHEHPAWGYGEKDELYISAEKDFQHDKDVYNRRAKNGFKNSIPKNAYFIWSKGTPLSYLRYLTLKTFKNHHPDYKMTLYLSNAIDFKNWSGKETQEYYNKQKNEIKDYIPNVKLLGIDIIEYNSYSNLNPTQIADIFRFEILHKYGGWFFDLDQLFLNRIENIVNTNYDFIYGGKSIEYIGVIGAKKNSVICKEINEKQIQIIEDNKLDDYQSLGIILFQKYLKEQYTNESILQTDDHVFYPVYWDNVGGLYDGSIDIEQFNKSIALHWHGGYPASQVFNFSYTKDMIMDSMDSISTYLRKHKPLQKTDSIFNEIIINNTWKGEESLSGTGSSLEQTRIISKEIPKIIERYNIKTMLDAPCGDFFWMRRVDLSKVQYTGIDILEKMIELNKEHEKNNIKFFKHDLIKDKLSKYDLILCRDCLGHLSYKDIFDVLQNIYNSGSKYLLTTSFQTLQVNEDIETGGWRRINLSLSPFYLPQPIEIINEGCTEGDGYFHDKSLYLIEIDKLNYKKDE